MSICGAVLMFLDKVFVVCWVAIIIVAEDISFRFPCKLGFKVSLQMTYIDSSRHGYSIEVQLVVYMEPLESLES